MGFTERVSSALVRERAGKMRLAAASFLESTVVPIPLEVLVVPLMTAHPKRAFSIANAIFAGCLLGAFVFYWFGRVLFDPVVAPALDYLNLMDAYRSAEAQLAGENLFWAVFLVSVSPVPFQLATLSAGALGGDIVTFMLAVAASRAIRYYGLALLAATFGERIMALVGGRAPLMVGFVLLLLAGWLFNSFLL
ncbi:DedA family protein [Fulvimarina endophytica]|uniref:DedA family protein n=1 Tax=Fulvimarina endophytica TaxID=2293836 RepID=A0A371XB15_9HYPH|nr:VTT domain-containing protein [Fulvimarina endophytica]RFC66426.1 DedA family protein [Fulvimarina endophytica]